MFATVREMRISRFERHIRQPSFQVNTETRIHGRQNENLIFPPKVMLLDGVPSSAGGLNQTLEWFSVCG